MHCPSRIQPTDQNHNPYPGPVYASGGYAPSSLALQKGPTYISSLLDQFPDLVNDITTGGATPLHMCGMSRRGQLSTQVIIERGGRIEALDTYGYTPLHRMASNNLAVGAEALLEAGADPRRATRGGETALSIATQSNARDVIEVLSRYVRHR